jgi:signal transduction histidine kinase
MSADEYADAKALDERITAHFWRYLGLFVLMAGLGAVVAIAIFPALDWREAFFWSGVVCMYLLFAVLSPWYGYRRWTRSPAWKIFAVLLTLTMVGAAVGFAIGSFRPGHAWSGASVEKAARAMGVSLLLAFGLTAMLVGIARLRMREAVQRAARMQAEAERERLVRQGVQAELKLLQAQVEPHFLFNTLANVRHLVQTGSPDAIAMLDHLIKYLRAALPEIRSDGSTLGREAELARAYLEIMKLRMGREFGFEVQVPDSLARMPFPPLMLLTLVENAIQHGVAPQGRGHIAVRAIDGAERVRVDVEDDGTGIGGLIGQGVGLANLRERLAALYGERARFELASREGGGARASIEVPA